MSYFAAVRALFGAAAVGAEGLGVGFGAAVALVQPAAIAVIAGGLGIGALVTLVAKGLRNENPTMRAIQSRLEQQNLQAALDDLEKMGRSASEETRNRIRKELEADEEKR